MEIRSQLQKMDALVSQGSIVDAVKQFFAENASTSNYGANATKSKNEMIAKMEGFAGAIAKVNGIKHHYSLLDGNVSASEFTFDFDMVDGSKIYWHEIIRRVWSNEGLVIEEEYFNAE
jgi:hypothetical protein